MLSNLKNYTFRWSENKDPILQPHDIWVCICVPLGLQRVMPSHCHYSALTLLEIPTAFIPTSSLVLVLHGLAQVCFISHHSNWPPCVYQSGLLVANNRIHLSMWEQKFGLLQVLGVQRIIRRMRGADSIIKSLLGTNCRTGHLRTFCLCHHSGKYQVLGPQLQGKLLLLLLQYQCHICVRDST